MTVKRNGSDLGDCIGHEALTVTNAAVVSPTAATVGAASTARVTVESAPVRYREDATDPTTTTGHELVGGSQELVVGSGNLARLSFIATTATNATVRLSYYK